MTTTFLSYADLKARTGLSKVTIWRMFNRGEFPKPVRLSRTRVGFVESEVEAWAQGRITESHVAETR